MIIRIIKPVFFSNAMLPIMSLIIGYSAWFILSQNMIVKKEVNLPLCFYNQPENLKIEAPELIKTELQSTRSILSQISDLAFYIDIDSLKLGTNIIELTKENLYTPNINLVKYFPNQIIINLTKVQHET